MVEREVKKEFDALAAQISRLEAIRDELDALDTTGFEAEVHLIRARLKDVTALPEIERSMKRLREKIRERGSKGKSIERTALEESKLLKQKIAELEAILTKKQNLSEKMPLSSQEKAFVKDIPQLEKQLKELRSQFSAHLGKSTVKVDSGVGVIVDSKFDDFILELKGELTKRVEEKEIAMDQALEHDLAAHEQAFREKYAHLVKEFDQKYREKVEHELSKEISKKLNSEVEKRVNQEKQALLMDLGRENMKRLELERTQLTRRLEGRYAHKMNQLSLKMKAFEKKESLLKKKALVSAKEHERIKKALLQVQKANEHALIAKKRTLDLELKKVASKEEAFRKRFSFESTVLAARQAQVKELETKARSLDQQLHEKLTKLNLDKKKYLALVATRVKEAREKDAELLRTKINSLDAQGVLYSKQIEQMKARLAKEARRKEAALRVEQKQLKQKEALFKESHAKEARALSQQFEMVKSRYRQRLSEQEKKLHLKMNVLKAREEKEYQSLLTKKRILENKMKQLDELRRVEHQKILDEARLKESTLRAEMDKKLEKELRIREEALRKKMERDYAAKLKTEITRRSVEFDKRRAELEQHVIQQAKKLFR